MAVIDSGADYFHPDFRKEDGSTRILELWDQEADRIYSQEEINRALEAGSREAGYEIVGERDLSGHGTQVLAIAAGNGRASGGQYRGVAPESDLLVVKLGLAPRDGFPRTAEVMTAVEYVIRKAEALGKTGIGESQLRKRIRLPPRHLPSGNVPGAYGGSVEKR